MAKKELSEFDILKKQYSNLEKINQRLKNVCSGYYIGYDGVIYMKSIVGFVEKIANLVNPESIEKFRGCLILPNKFFEFSKKAKKTKLTITATEKGYYFGQDDDDDLQLEIPIQNPNKLIDQDYITTKIKPTMYKRFFEITDENRYFIYEDSGKFTNFSSSDINLIASANPLYLSYQASNLTITKHLILDVKKTDLLGISRISYQKIDHASNRVFYMLKQQCDLFDIYTIFNTLQSY